MPNINQQAAEFLTRVRKRIKKPENWHPRLLAANAAGEPIALTEQADRWSMSGAWVIEEALSPARDLAIKALQSVRQNTQEPMVLVLNLMEWEETATHAEVLALLDKAIEELIGWKRDYFKSKEEE